MAKFTAEQLLNHLYDKRLPQVYREADIDTQYCLKRFLQSMIEGGFAETISLADGITDLTDPLKCPDKYFPILFESFGYKYSPDIPIIYQRKILQNHGELWQKRGTIEYVYVLSRILTGFDSNVSIVRNDKGVRVMLITLYVDSTAEATESQEYVNIVKTYVKNGYIPFYLDIDSNIMVDVQSIHTTPRYLAMSVEAKGEFDLTPIVDYSKTGFAMTISPTLPQEPFTKFEIQGYSQIVPRYLNDNIVDPKLVQTKVHVDLNGNVGSSGALYSAYTGLCYVPYGSKLNVSLQDSSLLAPNLNIFLFDLTKSYKTSKVITYSAFTQGRCTIDLSDVLNDVSLGHSYYVSFAITDREGLSEASLSEMLCVSIEGTEYVPYSATTRMGFDDEYYKNGEAYPVYKVDVYDANGPISFPYCSTSDYLTATAVHSEGALSVESKGLSEFKIYTDCISAMKDNRYYYFAFSLYKFQANTLDAPIVSALCTNNKGSMKRVTLQKMISAQDNEDKSLYRYGYRLFVPVGYTVVHIEYLLCNTHKINDFASVLRIACYDCNDEGFPNIDNSPQDYVLADDLNTFKNNLSIGLDGIALLSHNNNIGEAIVRDTFDVLTGIIHRRVGVTYDSLGNPISTYALASEQLETVTEDLDGEVKAIPLTTFTGKTFISMSYSMANSVFVCTGDTRFHSCVSVSTRKLK